MAESSPYDVVIYGGTLAGVATPVQAARMGKSVVIIEPGRHLCRLTAARLGATDIGKKSVFVLKNAFKVNPTKPLQEAGCGLGTAFGLEFLGTPLDLC
jgi:hypothetical protein